jgi:hypothetical protein
MAHNELIEQLYKDASSSHDDEVVMIMKSAEV